MTHVRRPLIVTACVALSLAGCSNSSGAVVTVGDTTVLVAEPADDGMDALLSGTVQVVGGCLGINAYVVVWPNGTEVGVDDPTTVDVPGHGTLNLGDEAKMGGGLVYEPSDGSEPADYKVAGITVHASCAKHGIWLASPR
jgi:hypothetical protein